MIATRRRNRLKRKNGRTALSILSRYWELLSGMLQSLKSNVHKLVLADTARIIRCSSSAQTASLRGALGSSPEPVRRTRVLRFSKAAGTTSSHSRVRRRLENAGTCSSNTSMGAFLRTREAKMVHARVSPAGMAAAGSEKPDVLSVQLIANSSSVRELFC
jgi:hypothetical protein